MSHANTSDISKHLPDFFSPLPQKEVLARLLKELKSAGWVEGDDPKAIHHTDVWIGKVGQATAYWVPQIDEIDRENFSEAFSKETQGVFGGIFGDDLFEFDKGEPQVRLEHDGNGVLGNFSLFDLLNPSSLDPAEAKEIRDGACKEFGAKLVTALEGLKTEFSDEKMIRTYFEQRYGLKGADFTVQKATSLYYPYVSSSQFPVVDEVMQVIAGMLGKSERVVLPGLGELKRVEQKLSFRPDDNFLDWLDATDGDIEEIETWPDLLEKTKKPIDRGKLKDQYNRWIAALRQPNLSILADDFFQMSVRTLPAYQGQNPVSGKPFTIPAKRTALIYFR